MIPCFPIMVKNVLYMFEREDAKYVQFIWTG